MATPDSAQDHKLKRNFRNILATSAMLLVAVCLVLRCTPYPATIPGDDSPARELSAEARRRLAVMDRKLRMPPPQMGLSVSEAEDHVRRLGGLVVRNVSDQNRVFVVKFTGNDEVIDEDLAILTKLSELKSLRLFETPLVDGSGLKYAKGCPRLESIFLCDSAFSDQNMVHLRHLQNLRSLYLHNTQVDGSGLSHLANLRKLKTIEFGGSPVSGASFTALVAFPTLEDLSAPESGFDDSASAALSKMSSLKRLSVSGTRITDAGVKFLANIPNLTVLRIANTNVTDESMVHLADCTLLYHLDVSDTAVTDAGLLALAKCRNLAFLNVSGNQVSSATLLELAANCELQEVIARETHIVPQDVIAAKAVRNEIRVVID